MAYTYLRSDRDQLFLLPPSMKSWLPTDHLAWFVLDVVDKVDTSAFHARHPNDGVGRAAYDPEMMLALLMYAYCTNVRSSRRIEGLCRSDVAYRVLCANRVPDHATIARFRADHEAAIEGVFVDVLVLCAAAGLTTLGTIAIDGTKMGADASMAANRGAEAIRAEVAAILAEAGANDTAEHDRLGGARGDELPPELANPVSRLARLDACLARIQELEAEAQAEMKAKEAKIAEAAAAGRKLAGHKPKDPRLALVRAEADVAVAEGRAQAAKERSQRRTADAKSAGRRVKDPDAPSALERADAALAQARQRLEHARTVADGAPAPAPAKAPVANTTDPDSRVMKAPKGYVQGYNAQAAVNEQQVVMAWGLTQEGNDYHQLVPMMAAIAAMLAAVGITATIGWLLFDAGYWSEANATAPGPNRLIATKKDWRQRGGARKLGQTSGPPPEGCSPLDAMEHRLHTPEGAAAYARRAVTVEPVFGDHKENRGFRRFMRRGLPAVRSEWSFINTTHNVMKLFRHGAAPASVAHTSD